MKIARLGAGVLLGLAGAFVLAGPAQAHEATLTGHGDCADTGWTANITITNTWPKHEADIQKVTVWTADGKPLADLKVVLEGNHVTEAGQPGDEVKGTIAVPDDLTTIKVKAELLYTDHVQRSAKGTIEAPKDCAPPPTTPPATPPASPTPSPSPSQSTVAPAPSASTPAGPTLPTTGSNMPLLVGGAAVLLALGGLGVWLFRRRKIRFAA